LQDVVSNNERIGQRLDLNGDVIMPPFPPVAAPVKTTPPVPAEQPVEPVVVA